MVRYHLKVVRVVTTVLDKEGIEPEVNLGALLDKPEAILVLERTLFLKYELCSAKAGARTYVII
jgi:hypothetical protein